MCKIKRSKMAKKAIHERYCHYNGKNECGFTDVCKMCDGHSEIYNYKKCGVSDFQKGFNAGWDALVNHLKGLPWDKAIAELGIIIVQDNEEDQ